MPSLSFDQIGFGVVILMFLGVFYFQWASYRRAEKKDQEPRHTPPIDEKIENRVKTTEQRFGEELARVRAESRKEEDKLHGRISGLRDEIKVDLDKNSSEVRGALKEMRDIYTNTVADISGMKGQLTAVDQRTHHIEGKLDRHIEQDK